MGLGIHSQREKVSMKMFTLFMLCLGLMLSSLSYAQDTDDHDDAAEHQDDVASAVELSADEQRSAGVVIDSVMPRSLNETARVPGEVVINAYRHPAHYSTSRVSSCATR